MRYLSLFTRITRIRLVGSKRILFLSLATVIAAGYLMPAIGGPKDPMLTAPMKWAYLGNLSLIKTYLEEGHDINSRDKQGLTLLSYAVSGQQDALVQFLLSHGANPQADGGGCVCAAATLNNPKLLYWLIAAGADINTPCGGVGTPLISACQKGNLQEVEVLLSLGSKVNEKNDFGWTALMLASQNDLDIVKILIGNNADVNLQDNNGRTALMYACIRGRLDIVLLLLKAGANLHLKDKQGWTAERHAYAMGFRAIAALLQESISNNSKKDIKVGSP